MRATGTLEVGERAKTNVVGTRCIADFKPFTCEPAIEQNGKGCFGYLHSSSLAKPSLHLFALRRTVLGLRLKRIGREFVIKDDINLCPALVAI